MHEITEHEFTNEVRHDLRYTHRFEHHDLERAQGIFTDTLEKIGSPGSLRASHFDKAIEQMHEHADWKRLSEHQRSAVESTLKHHLGIKDD